MKRYIYICVFAHFSFFAFGQKDLSGTYLNESQSRAIIITNDSLRLIAPASLTQRTLEWTFTEATFKWVADNFIEINSTPPFVLAMEGLRVEELMNPTIDTDSLMFSFCFPNYEGQLDISVYDIGFIIDFDFKYSDKNKELVLNKPNFRFPQTLVISITNPTGGAGELSGLCRGFTHFTIVSDVRINENVNHILIEVPAVNDAFFALYYIRGEYAKISGNTITWKGEIFRRERGNRRGR